MTTTTANSTANTTACSTTSSTGRDATVATRETPVDLFPLPRSVVSHDGRPDLDGPLIVHQDPDLAVQGYTLSTSADGTVLRHRDALGLRYGLATLDQLRANPRSYEVCLVIEDHPDLPHRAFLLDASRDRVPTRSTLSRLVRLLQLARYTQLQIYTEHTFTFPDEEEVWQDASPFTPKDLEWLQNRCASAGIELVPCLNTFGHLERFLSHPRHQHRAENPNGFDRGGVHRASSTVAPSADNADFAYGLITALTSRMRSRHLNIGADEPFELGLGLSRDEVASRGLGTVYGDHLQRLLQPWLERGHQVQFWADVFVDHPELAQHVPPGAVPVVWQYDSPTSAREVVTRNPGERQAWEDLGADVEALAAGFARRAAPLIEAEVPFWVAPGTGNWNSVLGRLDNARENIVDALSVAAAHQCPGVLVTSWGDHGHWDPPAVTDPPTLFAGAAAWCLTANLDIDLAAVLDAHVYEDETGLLGRSLLRCGSLARDLGVPLLNGSPVARALLIETGMGLAKAPDNDALEAARLTLASCLVDLRDARPAVADGAVLVRELVHAVELADFALGLLQGGYEPTRALHRLDDLLAEQRACWLLRARPGGLDDSLARFAPLRRRLLHEAVAC